VCISCEVVLFNTNDGPTDRRSATYASCFVSSRDRVANGNEGPDPYNYTSGRWLRRDTLERESRLIHFDFDALCRRAVALCPGASSITSYDKKEGGFNRVFIFYTDNAKRIVARLPFALSGPSRLTTNSEVATIKYCKFYNRWVNRSSSPTNRFITFKCKPKLKCLFRRYWTGATTPQMRSAANTSSWNMH
jgi:hypothetical protein